MALKGIEKVEERFCVQTAVYWGNPQNDGYGGFTFDDPIELSPDDNNGVRWDDRVNLEYNKDGNILLGMARVLCVQDLDEQGYLYLGTLDDLSGEDTSKPQNIDKAYIIRRFDKVPMVRKADEFVRIAYLYDNRRTV